MGRLASGGLVIAGSDDDSGCCRWDSLGAFTNEPSQGPSAWVGWFDPSGSKRHEHWTWGYLRDPSYRPRWFDLATFPDGSVVATGNIGDSVLFTGTERISHGTRTVDSLKTQHWSEVIAKGGGGGIGIARWSADGRIAWARLLRLGRSFFPMVRSIAWQLASIGDSAVFLAGNITMDSIGAVWDGTDSLQLPAASTCLVARFGIDGTRKGMTGLPCKRSERPSLAATKDGAVWMVQANAVSTDSDTSVWGRYEGFRPFLARMDGMTPTVIHPLGALQGSFRAIAAHENGSLLIQGEQASTLDWYGRSIVPHPDTTRGGIAPVVRSSFLLLADTAGRPVAFKSLKGLSNAGGWKIRRIPGEGWLLLSWDEQDLLGWSRLYLLDDSLNIQETSDTLPATLDIEVANDGTILLSGIDREPHRGNAWLKGSGTMWAATGRIDPSSTHPRRIDPSRAMRWSGSALRFDLPPRETARLTACDLTGRIVYRETVRDGSAYQPPSGVHVLILRRNNSTETVKAAR